jgi:transposase
VNSHWGNSISSGELRGVKLRMAPSEVVEFLATLPGPVRAVYEAGPTGFGLARADSRHVVTIVALRCLRGIDTLSAAGLCAEVGDWQRFRPKQLSGFLGIVPSEYTSDTKRRQGQITKAGSTHARRLLVEAAHHYHHRPAVGDTLARRQRGQDPRVIEIAWRAQRRLHQRWNVLRLQRHKPAGVVAIACARELAAFCWEAATLD